MNNRPIDKTNKKNIYCDHCKHYAVHLPDGTNDYTCHCLKSKNFGKLMNYWNRCKAFEWKGGDEE